MNASDPLGKRVGGKAGHAENMAKLTDNILDAVEAANLTKLCLAPVLSWIELTGLTGMWSNQQDKAAHDLVQARQQARKLAEHLDRALATMRGL